MPNPNKTYTYRCGEKIELEKSSDQMVARALRSGLEDAAITSSEQVLSAPIPINVSEAQLQAAIEHSRAS